MHVCSCSRFFFSISLKSELFVPEICSGMCDVHVAFTNLSEIVLMLFQGQEDAEFSAYFSSSGNFKRSIHYMEKVASAAH